MPNSNHSKPCFRKTQFEATFRQFSALNFEKNCQTKVILVRKDKHVNFAGV